MRKKLLFILSLLVFSTAGAQSIQLLDANSNVVNGDTLTFTHYMDTLIQQADFKHDEFVAIVNTTTTDTMNIDLIRQEIDIIEGSADYYCWGTQCLLAKLAGTRREWQAFDPVETFPQDTAGGSAPLAIYLAPRGNDGVALFKYTFTDLDDRSGNNTAEVYVRWVVLDTTDYADPVMLFNEKPRKFSVFGDSISRKVAFNADTLVLNSSLNDSQTLNPLFEKEIKFNLFNATGGTLQLDMIREEIATIPRSGDYFLWNGTTTSETPAGSSQSVAANNPVTVEPRMVANDDFSIKLFLQADSAVGTAIYKYSYTDINDPTKTGSLVVKWVVDYTTSLEEKELHNNLVIYPNPAESTTNIKFGKGLNYSSQEIRLFNILGEQVLVTPIRMGAKNYELDVEGLPKGIYFVNLVADGARLSSKKLIVK